MSPMQRIIGEEEANIAGERFPQLMSNDDHTRRQRVSYSGHHESDQPNRATDVRVSFGKGLSMVNTGFMRQNYHEMTADVICLCCFQTVAESKPVAELAGAENQHICNPYDIHYDFNFSELSI